VPTDVSVPRREPDRFLRLRDALPRSNQGSMSTGVDLVPEIAQVDVMPPVQPSTPRLRNAAATKLDILTAATAAFLEESFENVGVRQIAASAGVDVALISRYFGSKRQLFIEVLKGCDDRIAPAIQPAGLAAHYADAVLQQGLNDGRGDVQRLLIILRSASSPEAAEIVRETLRDNVLAPSAALLEGPDAEVRASLSMAVWIGVTVLRNVMLVPPISDAASDLVRQRLIKLFDAALSD
jgi:AcrR family transcriptional regulator